MDEEKTLVPKTVFEEDEMLRKFRRALRRSDQVALDDLIGAAKQHVAAMEVVSHATPVEMLLLALLLEEHKEVARLRSKVEGMI